jgi:hypothetical protein
MVSIFPERHRPRHLRPRLRPVELNPCKAGPICTHLVLIIGCPVWIRVGDAEMRRQPRYTTSFRNAYGPLPNSHSLLKTDATFITVGIRYTPTTPFRIVNTRILRLPPVGR